MTPLRSSPTSLPPSSSSSSPHLTTSLPLSKPTPTPSPHSPPPYFPGGTAIYAAHHLSPRQYYSIWTITVTETRTYSSWIPAGTAAAGSDKCEPPAGSGQIACGSLCCASWQYCAYDGQCMANGPAPSDGSGGGGVVIGTTVVTGEQTVTTQFSAPYRVTSGTATGTTVVVTGTALPGEGEGRRVRRGLSGGAIAGIVVGTIAGVALLLLICACCVVRGLWHGLMAVFGIGGKKKEREKEVIIEEERYTRHGSVHGRRDNHGSWYSAGGAGGRPSSAAARKEKSKGAGLLGLGAALGTLALLLGLKKDKKKRAPSKHRSDVSSSYWSESYTGTNPSSRSSDRRSRHARSARDSRAASRVTRTTHTHTRVSRSRQPSRSRAPSARSHRSPR